MNPNTYQKKEIIKPNRICALKECSKPFVASRQDQIFHSHKCAEKQWRLKHPRKTHYKQSTFKSQEICSARDVRRDTPERLTKYLTEICPGYLDKGKSVAEFVGSVFGYKIGCDPSVKGGDFSVFWGRT
jgi:hypothetical protein